MTVGNQREELNATLARVAGDNQLVSELYALLHEYCHRARNHLHCLNMGLYLARRGEAFGDAQWSSLERAYRNLESLVESMQTLCRPMTLSIVAMDLSKVLEDRRERWSELFRDTGASLDWNPPDHPTACHFDPFRLADALDRWAAWRAEETGSGTAVTVSWAIDENNVVLHWLETQSSHARLGRTNDRIRPNLALPILSRMTSVHGGIMSLRFTEGLDMALRLPLGSGNSSPADRTEAGCNSHLGRRNLAAVVVQSDTQSMTK
jgi:hypothetical protein